MSVADEPSDEQILLRLNAMSSDDRRELLQQLDASDELSWSVDVMEVIRVRNARHRSLARARARILKLEAVVGAAAAVLDAVDDYNARESTWGDVQREARRVRKAFGELVAKSGSAK